MSPKKRIKKTSLDNFGKIHHEVFVIFFIENLIGGGSELLMGRAEVVFTAPRHAVDLSTTDGSIATVQATMLIRSTHLYFMQLDLVLSRRTHELGHPGDVAVRRSVG